MLRLKAKSFRSSKATKRYDAAQAASLAAAPGHEVAATGIGPLSSALCRSLSPRTALDIRHCGADIRRFLRRHPAMLVEIEPLSVIRRARVDPLCIRQIDGADGKHFHPGTMRGVCRHDDHGRNAAIRGEGKSLDHLLVCDDLVAPARQGMIDAPDLERMLEGDDSRRERVVMYARLFADARAPVSA